VRRRWRLTVIVWAAHAWCGILIQLGFEPIEDPIDTLGDVREQSVELLVVQFDWVSHFF
jgi:hypothetical protein